MDIFDSLQPRVAEGSWPARYKQDFGERLSFWGGIDVQQTLPQGTPTDVCGEVRIRLQEMAPGGGYILSSSHRLQPDIPPVNILAMYEAAREYGVYPIRA
jgi:uroporphyrinogen decarboxylase